MAAAGRSSRQPQLVHSTSPQLPPSCPIPPSETILVFTKTELHAMAGPKKTDILEQLTGACEAAGVALRLHPKPKKEDGAAQIEALLEACRASADSPVVGTLPKVRSHLPLFSEAEAWVLAGRTGTSRAEEGAAVL